jgi:Flp pilus assembly pilin Flp
MRTSRRGATAAEYGLIAALVAVVSIASVTSVGTSVRLTMDVMYVAMAGPDGPPPDWLNGKFDEVAGGDGKVSNPEAQAWMASICVVDDCPGEDEVNAWYTNFDEDNGGNSDGFLQASEWDGMANYSGEDP